MGKPTETMSQVQRKKSVTQDDDSSTESHDLQNPRALIKLSILIPYTNNISKREIELMFLLVTITNSKLHKNKCKSVIENIFWTIRMLCNIK